MMNTKKESEVKVLCVGLCCVDLVNLCERYPEEDTDQRGVEQRWQRGGNASNSSSVLSILGAQAEVMATIAGESHEKGFILEDFQKYGIGAKNCVIHSNCSCPVSVVIINKNNGSRTIIHSNKNLPEITYEDFKKVDLKAERFSWIHFEGRRTNVPEIIQMLKHIDSYNSTVTDPKHRTVTSVELEKSCLEFDKFFDKADYVFVSKEFAQFKGCNNKEDAVRKLISRCKKGATLICPWGEDGACATVNKEVHSSTENMDSAIISVPVHSPPKVVDTLGAGDSFNAGTIYSLCRGRSLEESVKFGCKVAGTKCGMHGNWGLKECDLKP